MLVTAWRSSPTGRSGRGGTTATASWATGRRRTGLAPVQVSGLSGVVAVRRAGRCHSLAVKSDGTVWAWGGNYYGQLGDGTTTQTAIAPCRSRACPAWWRWRRAWYHSLAVKSDGTVWAWGDNYCGQLGDGTTTQRTTPVQVSGLSGVVAVAGGDRPTAWRSSPTGRSGRGGATARPVGRRDDDERSSRAGLGPSACAVGGGQLATAWRSSPTGRSGRGGEHYGQLGDGTHDRRIPGAGLGLSGVVSGGRRYATAWRSSPTGRSGRGGQLLRPVGRRDIDESFYPVQVSGLSGVVAVAGGDSHSLFLADRQPLRSGRRNLARQRRHRARRQPDHRRLRPPGA